MKKVLDLFCLIALVACEQGTNNAPVQVIAQIEPVAEIRTPLGAAPLFPKELKVTFTDGNSQYLPAEWNGPYDPTTPGKYEFTGKAKFTGDIQNPSKKTVLLAVTILEADSTLASDSTVMINFTAPGNAAPSKLARCPDVIPDFDSMSYSVKKINSTEYSYRIIENMEDLNNAKIHFGSQLISSDSVWVTARKSDEIMLLILMEHRVAKYTLLGKPKFRNSKGQIPSDTDISNSNCGPRYYRSFTKADRAVIQEVFKLPTWVQKDTWMRQLNENLSLSGNPKPITVEIPQSYSYSSNLNTRGDSTFLDLNFPEKAKTIFDVLVTNEENKPAPRHSVYYFKSEID